MKLFHISDLLSVTTRRIVSSRHMSGVYEVLNFLTSDDLFTHQLPRACEECGPWLATQFPTLMHDHPQMVADLTRLDEIVGGQGVDVKDQRINDWVESVRTSRGFPEMVPVYELGADMHTHIDPAEELAAMVGDARVIVARVESDD